MDIKVHLLGRMCIEIDETVIWGSAFPGRQGRLAFAYLTAHRRPVSRDELAEMVWADDDPPVAWPRHLAAVLSKLRAVLGHATPGAEHLINGAFGSYEFRLPAAAEIDIEAAVRYLEDAEAAVRSARPEPALAAADVAANLTRRPFLPGDDGPWIEQKRRELRAILIRSLELETAILGKRGDYRYALRLAEEAVGLEPFRESCWIELMRIHLAAGNRAEGLRAYDRCRSLLADELGVRPSKETESMYIELLHADAASASPPYSAL
jgi:SARP family transcriptional regulator, regulator of embCAB operon